MIINISSWITLALHFSVVNSESSKKLIQRSVLKISKKWHIFIDNDYQSHYC